ncbi:MAG TPA: peptidoglycan DD-metalloendopeptidase family protein [Candidatus Udaeobacter sp.]|nr:peptidoglycan DD-metalloendopeptidase family protein [Candidatus Udaeobacter sp.]
MKALAVAAVLAFAALVAGPSPARADTAPTDPQQQLQLIDQIRAQLGSNLADAVAAQQQLRQSLEANAAQQQDVQGKIVEATARIAELDTEIADAQRREAELSVRIDNERAQLRQIARAIYVSPGSVLLVVAESHSLGDLFARVSELNVAGSRATDLKASLDRNLTELMNERLKEQTDRQAEVDQRNQLDSELAQLRALQEQQQQSVNDLETKIEETRYELGLLSRQSTQLAQEVTTMLQQQQDAIIASAMQAVWAQLQLWLQANNVGQITTSAGHSTQYRFIWPEPQAQISQGFGPSTFWFEPPYGSYPHFHTGIDLVEPFGSPVYAADDGVVALVGSSTTGYGQYVVIAHAGGFDTLYGHLSTALVAAGQSVTQGAPVGLEGSSGSSTGPHLHFELRINQVPVNPTPYLPPGAPSPYKA